MEEERVKATILAGNPQLFLKLWPQTEEEEDLDWETPQTEEELAEFIREFEQGAITDPEL